MNIQHNLPFPGLFDEAQRAGVAVSKAIDQLNVHFQTYDEAHSAQAEFEEFLKAALAVVESLK